MSDEFERRIANGQDVRTALSEPIIDTRYGTLIRQVRVYQRLGRGFASGEDAIKVTLTGRAYSETAPKEKYYLSDGYAYVALIANDAGLIIDAVSVRSADAPIFDQSRVGRRIFRSDTVVDESGNRHLVHQILADGVIRTAPLIESRSWIQLGAESGGKSFGKAAVMKLKAES